MLRFSQYIFRQFVTRGITTDSLYDLCQKLLIAVNWTSDCVGGVKGSRHRMSLISPLSLLKSWYLIYTDFPPFLALNGHVCQRPQLLW